MKKDILIGFVCLGIIMAGTLISSTKAHAGGFSSLELKLTPEKKRLVPGEPLTLTIELTNPTPSAISAHRSIDPGYGTIQVQLASSKEDFKRYLGPGWGKQERPPQAAQIDPGESVYKMVTLLFNNAIPGRGDLLQSNIPLGQPGVYRIRVDLYSIGFKEKIKSSVIQVEVIKPDGANAAIWEAILSDPEAAYFIQTGDARKGLSIVKKIEELIAKQASAVHTRYFAQALGSYYLRQKDLKKAVAYLKQAAKSPPKSFLRAHSLLELAKVYVLSRDFDQAQGLCETTADEFAKSGLNREFYELCDMVSKIKLKRK